MTELKPCPFCGGYAKEFTGYDANPYRWTVECESCGAHVGEETRYKARIKWNRRAERTCRVEVERRKLSQTQTAIVKTCSGCGFEFGVEKENTLPFEVTLNVVVPPNYCPNCGARVTGDEK